MPEPSRQVQPTAATLAAVEKDKKLLFISILPPGAATAASAAGVPRAGAKTRASASVDSKINKIQLLLLLLLLFLLLRRP